MPHNYWFTIKTTKNENEIKDNLIQIQTED